MPVSPASSVFAMLCTGDIGGITVIQRAGIKRTQYAKTYPRKSPSALQKIFRARFTAALSEWKALDAHHKETLNLIAESKHMVMSGMNLYISCTLNHRQTWLEEWAQQLGRNW